MNFKRKLCLKNFPEFCQPNAQEIILVADGSCSVNGTKSGGWANLVLNSNGHYYMSSGNEYNTTNNRMELIAVINGLDKLHEYERGRKRLFKKIIVVSDSAYVVYPFTKYDWISQFFANEISTNTTNFDLWFQLIPLVVRMQNRVEFVHVRGHAESKTCDNKSKNKDCLNCDSYGCENPLYHYLNALVDIVAVNARLKIDK